MERKFKKIEKTKLCKYILENSDGRVEDKYSRFLVKYIFPNHPDWKEKEGVGIDHIEFHNTHTHLRAVSKRANLSVLRKS